MTDARWYYSDRGNLVRPVSAAELRDAAATGRLRPDEKVSPDGTKWAPASSVRGLKFGSAPASPVSVVVAKPQASEAISAADRRDLKIPRLKIAIAVAATLCVVGGSVIAYQAYSLSTLSRKLAEAQVLAQAQDDLVLGISALQREEKTTALKYLNESISKNPTAEAYYQRGLSQLPDLKLFAADADEAIRRHPSPDAYRTRKAAELEKRAKRNAIAEGPKEPTSAPPENTNTDELQKFAGDPSGKAAVEPKDDPAEFSQIITECNRGSTERREDVEEQSQEKSRRAREEIERVESTIKAGAIRFAQMEATDREDALAAIKVARNGTDLTGRQSYLLRHIGTPEGIEFATKTDARIAKEYGFDAFDTDAAEHNAISDLRRKLEELAAEVDANNARSLKLDETNRQLKEQVRQLGTRTVLEQISSNSDEISSLRLQNRNLRKTINDTEKDADTREAFLSIAQQRFIEMSESERRQSLAAAADARAGKGLSPDLCNLLRRVGTDEAHKLADNAEKQHDKEASSGRGKTKPSNRE